MKMKIAVMLSSLILMAVTVNAQGGYQRRTVEERVQMTHQKFDSTFKLDNTKQADVDSAFANFYRSADKIREDMMSGGGQPDFQAMREKMQPLMEERDKKLEGILTADQFKIWKDSLEPSMRPRRQNNGGGNNR
jgi:succinate dehydrogenase/fumarate reductase flavoprotein subunit